MYSSTREASSNQEKKISKVLGAKRTANSGATPFDKGDLYIGQEWLIEAKTCMENKKSFSIKKQWLDKMKEEQFACNKQYSSLCFDFGPDSERYYIVNEKVFKLLTELLEQN